jgi:hypothetical protein
MFCAGLGFYPLGYLRPVKVRIIEISYRRPAAGFRLYFKGFYDAYGY